MKKIFLYSVVIFLALIFTATDSAEAKFKFDAPKLTAEFDKMDFPPLYPTFSWEPLPKTEFYQVQVVKVEGDKEKIFSELNNSEAFNKVTDFKNYVEAGKYFWRVRVVDKKNKPLGDWSEKKFFEISSPVTYAVLGDSISHGGADYIPSGQLSCQWETYCDVPIKNLARSGDTTSQMVERFERDVLPFSPKVLLIFGGVNDIREGKNFDEVIKNFETLKQKCLENNITPIFGTLTPMNEKIIRSKKIFLTENDWRSERKKINDWILKNGGVDISKGLEDSEGELREDFTPDGLHPALRGKILIGKAVENYLHERKENLFEKN